MNNTIDLSKINSKELLKNKTIEETLESVYSAMKEKGYDPISQLVGYMLTGDPTYITSYKSARVDICQFERYDILVELISNYIKDNRENK